ncbi:MAG: respiratory nitrate reductase subunit gamma [Gammaproteobacteria bacterium]|nr:respiratory nitrate reductase subunit gamma [Gammaproteobacteria bacterium]
MTRMTNFFAALFYLAAVVFIGGVAWRARLYARTPAPLKIPTTPAPFTRGGVALRMLREVVLFESLFKASRWTWLFGWLFHFGLLLVLLRHLRYVTDPVWGWVAWLQPAGVYGGFAMLIGLAGLWARRLCVDRVRYISSPSDHLHLALLAAIAGSGLAVKYFWHTDIVAVKNFARGWLAFAPAPLPADPALLAHLAAAALLFLIFPISKLMHAPGLFFSPTRNQVDDSRARRHAPADAAA